VQKEEAAIMTLVGCDLHSRKQQVAVLDTRTGELVEQELVHEGDAVERFYSALPPPVTIGIETTGYTQWFHALMRQLGHTVVVGEAAKIRAMVVRKTKTDRRDARHLLDLLQHERFPAVWIPDPDTRDRRALIAPRVRLVRMRTVVKNGLQGDRPQPAAGAPLGVVDPAGAHPTEGPGPAPAHDAATR
jgi:transposase